MTDANTPEEMPTEPNAADYGLTVLRTGEWTWPTETHNDKARAFFIAREYWQRCVIESQAKRIAQDKACLDHYQARFVAITEAWRIGNNDAVLDAVRKHITAKDVEDADRLLQRAPEPDTSKALPLSLAKDAKNALAQAVLIAREIREFHDRDNDSKVMKMLLALGGDLPKYRSDIDRVHDVLRMLTEYVQLAPETTAEPDTSRTTALYDAACAACIAHEEELATLPAYISDLNKACLAFQSARIAPETCPHGMPLAENVCGPCSEGRPNLTVHETSSRNTIDFCIQAGCGKDQEPGRLYCAAHAVEAERDHYRREYEKLLRQLDQPETRDDRDETVTRLCDRLDEINKIAHGGGSQEQRLGQIQARSSGFMRIPAETTGDRNG